MPAHINLDKVSLHNGIIRQTSRRMRRHSHNNCVSWQKKKNRKYIYLCAYGHKTQCQMHKNSLHFITCSIVAMCMRINACARWRCYTTTHFMSERKTSKDPLEKKKARCLEKSNLQRQDEDNYAACNWLVQSTWFDGWKRTKQIEKNEEISDRNRKSWTRLTCVTSSTLLFSFFTDDDKAPDQLANTRSNEK